MKNLELLKENDLSMQYGIPNTNTHDRECFDYCLADCFVRFVKEGTDSNGDITYSAKCSSEDTIEY